MRIGLTFNLRMEAPAGVPEDQFEEFDSEDTIRALEEVFTRLGHETVRLGWGASIAEKIASNRVEFVFNIAEGLNGRDRESEVPALLERLGVPYSGSGPETLAIALDKALAKAAVARAGVLTPAFRVLYDPYEIKGLPAYPLFVKPLNEGSSKGIRESSRVTGPASLRNQIDWLVREYGRIPVLVEQFISGREFTVGVLGHRDPRVLGIMEIEHAEGKELIYSLEVKRDWQRQCRYTAPARIPASLAKKIETSSLGAWKALGCRDVARFDFRVDAREDVYFLEANPLPGLSPLSGDIVILAKGMGWDYDRFISGILQSGLERTRVSTPSFSRTP